MLGADGADMRMMVLYRNNRKLMLFCIGLRKLRTVKIRMQIMRYDLRGNGRIVTHALDGLIKPITVVCDGKIANDWRDISVIAMRQADGIFEPCATCQYRGAVCRQWDKGIGGMTQSCR